MYESEVKEVLTKPENYWGPLNDWIDAGYGPTFGKHRDSDTLGRSNYDSIEKMFREKYEYGLDFVTDSASHWAVGWVENIVVRVLDCKCSDAVVQERSIIRYIERWVCETCDTECTISQIFAECCEIQAALSDYPVFDEEDHSRVEYEEMMQYLEQEVGSDDAPALFEYLYNECSASRPDDIPQNAIEEWKEAQNK